VRISLFARGHDLPGRRTTTAGVIVLLAALTACTVARPELAMAPVAAAPGATPAPVLVAVRQQADPTTTTIATTVAPPVDTTTAGTTSAPAAPADAATTVPAPVAPPSAPPTMVTQVPPLATELAPLRRGSTGDEVRVLQQRLIDLGFWIDEVDGEYGLVTSQAVMAFQKYYGPFYVLDPSGNADAATMQVLRSLTGKPRAQATDGDLIEVDKTLQVLFVVRGGAAQWVFNASTGSGKTYTEVNQKDGGDITGTAITPEGHFKVYREYTDGWEKGQLGELYRPKYFKGGVAVHGLSNVPNYPASHGCVRVSLAAMDWIWANDVMPQKTEVWVHSD
jgi:peptidoglycan hydrolase-like protein with peptidoglycan-binding domain